MCKKTCSSVLATFFIVIALVLAIIVSIWRQESLVYIVYVSRFFDIMIPVLAVGALIKYLTCTCHSKYHHEDGEESCSCHHEKD